MKGPLRSSAACLVLLAGCDLIFSYDAGPTRAAQVDAAQRDAPASDTSATDGPGDARDAPQWRLTCEAPTPIANAGYATEPGMRVGGLELWATRAGQTVRAQRATLQDGFGNWTEFDSGGPFMNPAFFAWQGAEYAVIHRATRSTGARLVHLCALATMQCNELRFIEPGSGKEFTVDADGASVAVVDGRPMMLLNIGLSAGNGDVFQAQPETDLSLLSWRAEPVQLFADPAVHEDDPALSPDGTMIVVSLSTNDLPGDLWVAQRATVELPFSQPRLLDNVNSAQDDSSPEFFVSPDGRIELFFNSDRSGTHVVYRTTCVR